MPHIAPERLRILEQIFDTAEILCSRQAAQRPVFGAPASITLIVFSGHAFVVSHSNLAGRKDTKMKATCMNQLELAVRENGGEKLVHGSGGMELLRAA